MTAFDTTELQLPLPPDLVTAVTLRVEDLRHDLDTYHNSRPYDADALLRIRGIVAKAYAQGYAAGMREQHQLSSASRRLEDAARNAEEKDSGSEAAGG